MRMRAFVSILTLILGAFNFGNAQNNFWQPVNQQSIKVGPQSRQIIPASYLTFSLDIDGLKAVLQRAPNRYSQNAELSSPIITLPRPDGTFERFKVYNDPVMAEELARKTSYIQSFTGFSLDDPTAYLRFDYSQFGLHTMVTSADNGTIFIDPYSKNDDKYYICYTRNEFYKTNTKSFECGVGNDGKSVFSTTNVSSRVGDCKYRKYRLALAVTGEYTVFHGGTKAGATAAMNTTLTRINGVFEKELSIHMDLIPNNDTLIYLNGSTDPYTNADPNAMLNENQINCDNIIKTAKYDIGHVMGTGGGGFGLLNSPCDAPWKAQGATGSNSPMGDPFDIDYMCHEFGHQFGANHTFSASNTIGGCVPGTVSPPTSVEPGSGSSIMGYTGICGVSNIQPNSDPYFNAISLAEISANIVSGTSSTCPVVTTVNLAPTANAGSNYVIPKGTPFTLTGSGSDPNGHPITYCWEQTDFGSLLLVPTQTQTTGSVFRSFLPQSSPSRTFPRMDDIVNNVNPEWEKLPLVARTLNFRLTTRDNQITGGCTGEANMTVNVANTSGPFEVTIPTAAGISWEAASTQTVTWNVVGTTAAPINCANVDILLSTNGGLTYPIMVLSATANDGSEVITLPNNLTTTARIMVRGNNNIFFDISNNNFEIVAAVLPVTLISFEAKALHNNIQLSWKTASEKDNKGFELQRLSDDEAVFRKITWISGNGSSSKTNTYNYIDETIQSNKTYYYRLRQLDNDNKETFSKIEVASLKGIGIWDVQLQPNPAHDQIEVTLWGNINEMNSYRLVSTNGQLLKEGVFSDKYNQLDISALSKGLYFLHVLSDRITVTKKMIIE